VVAELATSLTATDAERLQQAEESVRGYCRWHIAPSRTETVTFPAGDYGPSLLLPTLRLTAVVSVIEGDDTLLADDDYTWSKAGILQRKGCRAWARLPIEVEFTHGYTAPPADVTGAVQSVAQRAVDNPQGLTSKTTGPFSESYAAAFNDAERAVLGRYRIPLLS
jgi:hypothetical protein